MVKSRVQIATELRDEILRIEQDTLIYENALRPQGSPELTKEKMPNILRKVTKIERAVAKALKEEWIRLVEFFGDYHCIADSKLAEEVGDITKALRIIGEVV